MPQPIAVIKVVISCEFNILSKRDFSTFKILPRSGKMAWYFLKRACLAEPPAESPSTINNSHKAGFFSWQSASLPGRPPKSSALLRRVISRALRAASRAREASMIFMTMALACLGFSSRYSLSFWPTADSTTDFISDDTSLSLVWDENLGSGALTESTAIKPSRESSPLMLSFCFLAKPSLSTYWFRVRVSAPRKPAKWVPPSFCGMLLVKQKILSW